MEHFKFQNLVMNVKNVQVTYYCRTHAVCGMHLEVNMHKELLDQRRNPLKTNQSKTRVKQL